MLPPPRPVGLRRHDGQDEDRDAVGRPNEAGISTHGEKVIERIHHVTDPAACGLPLGWGIGSISPSRAARTRLAKIAVRIRTINSAAK